MDAVQNHPTGHVLPQDVTPVSATRIIRLAGLTLFLCSLLVLGGTFLNGDFLIDPQGQPIANDFVNVVAAGRLALDGTPAAAYDWPAHKQAEVRAIGHDFAGYYGWHYPPTFLFVAAALAMLPFLAAAVVSLLATLGLYVAALWGILGRTGIFLALGFPAVLWNVTAGQNGCLTAALIGGTLSALERRPALAGLCLGLLTYKPQFGLLFPFALIANRRWLTIGVAAATALGLGALSWGAFGSASWLAFIHWMPITSRVVLSEGHADFARLQSVFGFIRTNGGGETLAWALQGATSLFLAVMIVRLWRGRAPYDLKAAALAAATLVATPYVYMYDLVTLAVAVAFLIRFLLGRGFAAREMCGLGAAAALILSFPYVKTQVGLAAVVIVLVLITQRARAALPPAKLEPARH
ncbi:MAG TPA: glycosyltransferase family 87 protein [Xanthobacteraceae bacterium]|nr:glycosyltransferase family 87 protein [Xanthobacteraceae bacterium]